MIEWGAARTPARTNAMELGALVALATAMSGGGGADWSALWVYVAAGAGLRIQHPWSLVAIFACAALGGLVGALDGETAGDAMGTVIGCLAVGMLVGGFRRLRQADRE